jgi:hypothetical protein
VLSHATTFFELTVTDVGQQGVDFDGGFNDSRHRFDSK